MPSLLLCHQYYQTYYLRCKMHTIYARYLNLLFTFCIISILANSIPIITALLSAVIILISALFTCVNYVILFVSVALIMCGISAIINILAVLLVCYYLLIIFKFTAVILVLLLLLNFLSLSCLS